MNRLILFLLACYKRLLSPLLGTRCRFHPSCSDYAREAVTRFGAWRGSLLALWRIARCQPLCAGGFDPVPETFTMHRRTASADCAHPPPSKEPPA
ncbi:MAG: membrane protein insertion efficiency factor YidD [Rudaea sp.]|nr:membrane protein insertion efficiency factor YidD [Rudaea sp.]